MCRWVFEKNYVFYRMGTDGSLNYSVYSTRQTPLSSRCQSLGTGTCSPSSSRCLAANSLLDVERQNTERKGFGCSCFGAIVPVSTANSKGDIMLYWTLMCLVIALIAGILGFTGIALAAAGIAKLLFVIFLVLFVISLATHLTHRGTST
jgi:uncharacterized membrane protein YtjA (UPF0391 family)